MKDTRIKQLEAICRIKGVREFILVDGSRVVSAHGTSDAEKKARAISNCGMAARRMSSSGFQYLLFSRENNAHLIVFPAGPMTLGIIKEKEIDSLWLVNQIKKVIKEIGLTFNKGVINDR